MALDRIGLAALAALGVAGCALLLPRVRRRRAAPVRAPARRRPEAEVDARGRAAGLALVAGAAVLLALGGPARGGDGDGGGGGEALTPATAVRQPADPDPGRAVFVTMGCGSCHRLAAGAGIGQVGPDLDVVLPNYNAAALRAKIVDPYPAGPPAGFLAMPDDFGRRMNARQVDELVAFLLGTVRR